MTRLAMLACLSACGLALVVACGDDDASTPTATDGGADATTVPDANKGKPLGTGGDDDDITDAGDAGPHTLQAIECTSDTGGGGRVRAHPSGAVFFGGGGVVSKFDVKIDGDKCSLVRTAGFAAIDGDGAVFDVDSAGNVYTLTSGFHPSPVVFHKWNGVTGAEMFSCLMPDSGMDARWSGSLSVSPDGKRATLTPADVYSFDASAGIGGYTVAISEASCTGTFWTPNLDPQNQTCPGKSYSGRDDGNGVFIGCGKLFATTYNGTTAKYASEYPGYHFADDISFHPNAVDVVTATGIVRFNREDGGFQKVFTPRDLVPQSLVAKVDASVVEQFSFIALGDPTNGKRLLTVDDGAGSWHLLMVDDF
jgi:hypothetical protein